MPTSFFSGAFFSGEFFFGSAPPIFVRDTHDGERKRKKFEQRIRDQEELSKQIREGLYGPDPIPVEKSTLPEIYLQTEKKVYIADYEMASKLRKYEELMADDEEAITLLLLQ